MNKKSLFLIGVGSLLALTGCGGGASSSSGAGVSSNGDGVSSTASTSPAEEKTFSVSVTKNDDVGTLVWEKGSPTDLAKVKEGTVLSFHLELADAYSKGTNLVVNANTKALTATDSVYTLPALKENVVISFSVDVNVYTITFSSSISDVTFVPIEGDSALPGSVSYGADAAFKVMGQGEYSQLADLMVLANGKELAATEGVYHLSNSAADWVVTANSSANVYSLNFHSKDTQGADKTVVVKAAYGSRVSAPGLNDYTYGGHSYHQEGWFDALEGGNAVSDFSASANSVKDFYAHYIKLSEITLFLEDGISFTTTDGNSYANDSFFFVYSGESCSFYLSFDSAHSQKADLSVCLGTTALIADSQGAYTFTPMGNASLTVICSKNSYEVSVTGSHLDRFDFVGETTASHGVDYQFKVALKDAYKADMVYVYNGATELKPDNQGYYTLNTTSAVSLSIDVVSISEDLFNAKRFGKYFLTLGASVVADTSVSSPSASIAISGLVVAQAKREGFTHLKFTSHHEGASHNEMVLVSGDAATSWDQYYKVLTACTGDFDFRVVLGSTTTSDESKTQFDVMARTDNVVSSSGAMTLSGFHFYTSPTSSWTLSSPMVYIAFEPDLGSDSNLVLDTVSADGGYFNFPIDISTALSKCEAGVRVYQKVVVDRASGIRVGTGLGYYYADVIFDYPSVTTDANLESGAPFAGYYWKNLNINQVVPSWGGVYANTTPDYSAHPFGLGLSFGGVEYFGVMYVHAAWGYPLMSRTTLIPSGALS